jgi:hypothetical protein
MYELMKINEVSDPHWVPDFQELKKCMFLTELPDRDTLEDTFLTDVESYYPIVSSSLFKV